MKERRQKKQSNELNKQIQRKHWKHNKSWKQQRYVTYYYNNSMQKIWWEEWQAYLRRIVKLKKDIKSLGKIPKNPSQLISTVKYFVGLINLTTNFADGGLSSRAVADKAIETEKFNSAIISISAREKNMLQFWNATPVGQNVTYNTLYLGMYSKIEPQDVTPDIQVISLGGDLVRVEVDLHPISDWLNKKVVSVDGEHICLIKQQDLAGINEDIISFLLQVIDEVLAKE